MPNPLDTRTRVHGVDFSGARDAGNKIWIASGTHDGTRLRIDACRQARELPGSGRDLEQALQALRTLVAADTKGVFGFDFPFGLPRALLAGKERWEDFVLSFPEGYAAADAFRARCREGDGGHERKRQTDKETQTPFSPYNLRLYRQTYYGIRELLHPLVRDRSASVLPMQAASPDKAWAIEICPASTLQHKGIHHTGYKHGTPQAYARRREILERIEGGGDLRFSEGDLKARILEDRGGDALDSVIAALAAFRALWSGEIFAAPRDQSYAREGYVYV